MRSLPLANIAHSKTFGLPDDGHHMFCRAGNVIVKEQKHVFSYKARFRRRTFHVLNLT